MGKRPVGLAQQELLAFHAAVLRLRREEGSLQEWIPIGKWQAMMVKALSTGGTILTRQSCQDKTWFLECLGLLQHKDREGVLILENNSTVVA